MNWFASSHPSFPYESVLARKQLGIPDSSEIHLAITTVAVKILPTVRSSSLAEDAQITMALRVASGAVLFGWPAEEAIAEARFRLNLPYEPDALPEHCITNRKDWLAEAAAQLVREGVAVSPRFQRQRSNYGWVTLDKSDSTEV